MTTKTLEAMYISLVTPLVFNIFRLNLDALQSIYSFQAFSPFFFCFHLTKYQFNTIVLVSCFAEKEAKYF